ncbi:hypothetical protein DYB32_005154 [Aphanomyces invadans]|uniref:Uncharacterized protein n=1 Tax=Aphanomyces invadans TaxID=157072 RepID=A0A3R6VWX6_9STRA|nr:hypothetical protein DYB32_005154 [Aphanomyces invadans]
MNLKRVDEGWLNVDKKLLERRLKTFGRDFEIKSMAVAAGLNDQEWGPATTQFRRSLVAHPDRHFNDSSEMYDFIEGLKANPAAGALQFYPLFLTFIKENGFITDTSHDMQSMQSLRELTDLRLPHTWYPKAHAMKRKIIYHGGPTNSGKTYEALLRLKQANDGLYCGPLRLLALEIYENLNMDGVYCSLITGEEKREIPSATHVACTVEMCSSTALYDVAVRKFADVGGDEFELRTYDRRSPLSIETEALKSYANIKKGDCIVGFSRRRIFQLPPETRSQQARLFNEPDNGYDILVASDAIGMGLNLNIGRIIFDSILKFDGDDMVDITPSLVCPTSPQCSDYAHGLATTFKEADLKYLKDSYEETPALLKAAGLFPSTEQFADIKEAAELLADIPMPLDERFTFCTAPANLRNPLARRIFVDYAIGHGNGRSVPLDVYLPKFAPRNELALRDIEIKSKLIDVYLWLSYRFPDTFKMQAEALELKEKVLGLVEEGLVNVTYKKTESTPKKRVGEWNEDRTKFIRYAEAIN